MQTFKKGVIVRYGPGPETLCRLTEPRPGGWTATIFDGSSKVVANAHLLPASKDEVAAFIEAQRARKA